VNRDQDTDSPLQGTATDGPVGDLTLNEFVLITPPKILSYLPEKCRRNGLPCTVDPTLDTMVQLGPPDSTVSDVYNLAGLGNHQLITPNASNHPR
jgi:hypothetical protein